MENRYPITGTVSRINETVVMSQYFRKREFYIRYTDTEFNNKIVERVIKFSCINDNVKLLDSVRIDDVITVQFYIDGRDVEKDGKTVNYTSVVCFELDIISSPQRSTQKEKNELIIPGGKAPISEATIEELMGITSDNEDPFAVINDTKQTIQEQNNPGSDGLPF